MSARILVADHIIADAKALEARLAEEYFEVIVATNGTEALEVCLRRQCDVVLLEASAPEMRAFEVCRQIKSDSRIGHLPVVMITTREAQSERLKGLEAGADEFLIKPINEIALLARVRSLVRLKTLMDELMLRSTTDADLGIDSHAHATTDSGLGARILLVEDSIETAKKVREALYEHSVKVEIEPQEALFSVAEGDFDLAIISIDLKGIDGLRLCSQIRSLDRTRLLPILIIAKSGDDRRIVRGLDIGINDYVLDPIDTDELRARVRTQARRKRFADRLRDSMQTTLEMGITDPTTGLHNGRYFDRHIRMLVNQAHAGSKPLSLFIADVDNLKMINDTYGHLAGAEVLREIARRLRKAFRGIDLISRWGGDEFVIASPDTNSALAALVAERIRQKVSQEPFQIPTRGVSVNVTISIGVSSLQFADDTDATMFERADAALYRAKNAGRNRVEMERAHSRNSA